MFEPPPLPPGKSVVDVFSDFLRYLFKCTREYITQSHPDGNALWRSIESNIDVVLSHPNGWEGYQQERMRQAAVQAGLVTQATAVERLKFVSEGQASIQYCAGSESGMAAASGFITVGGVCGKRERC